MDNKRPVIFYVDDEPHNLTVFEVSLSDNWDTKTFDNPVAALTALEQYSPCVIVSDQRMPGMSGVAFLELSRKIVPHAIRIIVTGYSDENLVVESVRKAQVFDYIRKPWEPDDLEASIRRALEVYKTNEQARLLTEELKTREIELQKQTIDLLKAKQELEASSAREAKMRAELECWVPPFVLWALKDSSIKFPIKRDIVGVTFDIIQSSKIHDLQVGGKPLRSLVIQAFSEAIIRHGGWRESHSGDSAYGHFGLLEDSTNPYEAALAVAREFRVALRGMATVHNIAIECGIALHVANDSTVDVHTVQLNTPRGIVTQKSFDTTSTGIDLLHRMEKIVHDLPGTNIIMSANFVKNIKEDQTKLHHLGGIVFRGQKDSVELYLISSDKVSQTDIENLKAKYFATGKSNAA